MIAVHELVGITAEELGKVLDPNWSIFVLRRDTTLVRWSALEGFENLKYQLAMIRNQDLLSGAIREMSPRLVRCRKDA